MDLLVTEQFWAIGMLILGSIILSKCSKWEKEDRAFDKDPRNKYGKNASDKTKPKSKTKSTRGTIMTTIGTLLCLGAMVLFLMHV
jgi:hypothetical protein